MTLTTHQEKVRITIECSIDERTYIKMLAAKRHITISEYLLSFARQEMPKCGGHHCRLNHSPNEETRKALKESREGEGELFESLDDFWNAMGISTDATA